MSGGVRGKEHEWSYKAQDGQELKAECVGMTWSESVENRHCCFQNDHAHHMLQMVWKCNCTDSSRNRGIMFGSQPSPLASYQCFWDVITGLLLQGRTRDAVVWFYWSNLYEHKCTCLVGGVHNQWSFQHCFQSLCLPVPEWCTKSYKDHVVSLPITLRFID